MFCSVVSLKEWVELKWKTMKKQKERRGVEDDRNGEGENEMKDSKEESLWEGKIQQCAEQNTKNPLYNSGDKIK